MLNVGISALVVVYCFRMYFLVNLVPSTVAGVGVRERNVGCCPTLPPETKCQTSATSVRIIEGANCFSGRSGYCAAI